jgi:hypothetical protein
MERTVSQKPEGDENDLVYVMNLRRRWTYPCERLSIKPGPKPESEQLTMAAIGGSFTWELIRQLSASRQFSEIDFFFYYKLYEACAVNGNIFEVRTPGTPIDFKSEIFAANCLLLEINEGGALSSDHHLAAFVADALAHLPNTSTAR